MSRRREGLVIALSVWAASCGMKAAPGTALTTASHGQAHEVATREPVKVIVADEQNQQTLQQLCDTQDAMACLQFAIANRNARDIWESALLRAAGTTEPGTPKKLAWELHIGELNSYIDPENPGTNLLIESSTSKIYEYWFEGCKLGFYGACLSLLRSHGGRAFLSGGAPPHIRYVTRQVGLEGVGTHLVRGEARVGAPLIVIAEDGPRAKALVPGFFSPATRKELSPAIVVSVPVNALGDQPLNLSQWAETGLRVSGYILKLRVAPEGEEFAVTTCKELIILDHLALRGTTWRQLAQESDGVRIVGWSAEPIKFSWGERRCCRPTISTGRSPIPDGYMRLEPKKVSRAFKAAMVPGRELHWIKVDNEGAHCESFRFNGRELLFSSPSPGKGGGSGCCVSWQGRDVDVGACSRLGHLCAGQLEKEVVEVTKDSIGFVSGGGGHDELVMFYAPEDVTRWWLNRKSCEAALAKNPRIPIEMMEPSSGRIAPPRASDGGCWETP